MILLLFMLFIFVFKNYNNSIFAFTGVFFNFK